MEEGFQVWPRALCCASHSNVCRLATKDKSGITHAGIPQLYFEVDFPSELVIWSILTMRCSYVQNIGSIIARAQITNGGPVILVQPENEYSQATPGTPFPNHEYFAAVEAQLRNAGIVVP